MSPQPSIFRTIIIPSIAEGYAIAALLSAYLGGVDERIILTHLERGLARNAQGIPLRHDYVVTPGESIRLDLFEVDRCVSSMARLEVLFESNAFIALNKPAGILVHPAGGLFQWTLIDMARLSWRLPDLDLCHRLDRETSGVLLLAKNRQLSTHAKLQFEHRQVHKEYVAYVEGEPTWLSFDCTDPIRHAADDRRVRREVHPEGSAALTHFTVTSRHSIFSEIRCEPVTGRSHQIRVHLAHLGHPVVGDALYPTPRDTGTRHALHCALLSLRDHQNEIINIEAPVPEDMTRLLEPIKGPLSHERL